MASLLETTAPHFHEEDGFVYPDWKEIAEHIFSTLPEEDWDAAFLEVAVHWVDLLGQRLGGDYRITSSENFLLLSNCEPDERRRYGEFCEQALTHILWELPAVAAPEDYGKMVVVLVGEQDDYYRYITHFYGDGEHPQSGGIFVGSGGYGHIVMPRDSWGDGFSQGTFLHELTHACVAHLPLPSWLNEALAMQIDGETGKLDEHRDEGDPIAAHHRFWDRETIQSLWSGQIWGDPENNILGYEIAEILWNQARHDLGLGREQLMAFVAEASWEDGGEAAFRKYCGMGLGDLAARFLGPGEWSPAPGL